MANTAQEAPPTLDAAFRALLRAELAPAVARLEAHLTATTAALATQLAASLLKSFAAAFPNNSPPAAAPTPGPPPTPAARPQDAAAPNFLPAPVTPVLLTPAEVRLLRAVLRTPTQLGLPTLPDELAAGLAAALESAPPLHLLPLPPKELAFLVFELAAHAQTDELRRPALRALADKLWLAPPAPLTPAEARWLLEHLDYGADEATRAALEEDIAASNASPTLPAAEKHLFAATLRKLADAAQLP
jgi:hypothetical protein